MANFHVYLEQLKSAALLQLLKHGLEVAETALCNLPVLLKRRSLCLRQMLKENSRSNRKKGGNERSA